MVLITSLFSASTSVRADPLPARAIDVEQDCLEAVPESASVTGVTDDGQEVSLDVLILLDNVTQERAEEVISKAQMPYTPLSISLDVRYEKVDFAPDTQDEIPRISSTRALTEAKKWTGGSRPADVDLVYVLTDKDLSDAAGRADCIGGVRYPQHAFAVGENYRSEDLAGLFYKSGTAKIAAHEIGHVMGAHHHYANCAEGIPGAIEEVGPTPCSTMFNFLDFFSLGFSTVSAATIRGHAIDFAAGGPDEDPIHTISVTFDAGTGKGDVTPAPCARRAAVELQLETEEEWEKAGSTKTDRKGRFRLKIPTGSGHYRTFVAERAVKKGEETCAQGASEPFTVEG